MPRTKQEKQQLQNPQVGIPPEKYLESNGIKYITFAQIELYHTWEQVQVFDDWFYGQTGILLEDGTPAVYIHDYERWVKGGMK